MVIVTFLIIFVIKCHSYTNTLSKKMIKTKIEEIKVLTVKLFRI